MQSIGFNPEMFSRRAKLLTLVRLFRIASATTICLNLVRKARGNPISTQNSRLTGC